MCYYFFSMRSTICLNNLVKRAIWYTHGYRCIFVVANSALLFPIKSSILLLILIVFTHWCTYIHMHIITGRGCELCSLCQFVHSLHCANKYPATNAIKHKSGFHRRPIKILGIFHNNHCWLLQIHIFVQTCVCMYEYVYRVNERMYMYMYVFTCILPIQIDTWPILYIFFVLMHYYCYYCCAALFKWKQMHQKLRPGEWIASHWRQAVCQAASLT